ncbi:hypothetical protein [Sandaracinus amylolyticus]|uniref:Uncharacterized protein n=1 Tax=Sandaracinus amylolyticus TaxID=927083 RepID=A0A0F6W6G8_9BACT|nr:hypothetical protein [Sandaracinus amylolyticus]AKF08527.1 hypothetical protein DB32_005676 [Sandaracinus amylolyticus]
MTETVDSLDTALRTTTTLGLLVASTVALASRTVGEFAVVGGLALVLGGVAALVVFLRARAVLDDTALHTYVGWRVRSIPWSEVTSVTVEGRRVVVTSRGARTGLDPRRFAHPDAMLRFVRDRVGLDAWTLDERTMLALALGPPARPAPLPSRTRGDAPAGYREPPRASGPVAVATLFPLPRFGRADVSAVDVALGGAVLAAAGVALSLPEPWRSGVFVATIGAVAALAYRVRARFVVKREMQRARALRNAAFVGGLVRIAHGAWTSLDGTRRRRHHAVDLVDPWGGSHQHYERIDPTTGETLESYLATSAGVFEGDARPRTREVGVLPQPIDSKRHFDGFPPELARWIDREAIPRGAAKVLVIDTYADAVFVHRFSASRDCVGDTMHADRDAAMRQLASEYPGVHIEWKPVDPAAGRWAFWSVALSS